MELINLLLLAPTAFGLSADSSPIALKSRIIEASVFKSGLVMITREVAIPAGDGKYVLDEVPLATDGSFWYSSPGGVLVTDVETTLRTKDEKVKVTAQTVGDYLALNVGQHVKLSYRTVIYGVTPKDNVEQLEGVINGPPRAQTNIVPFKLANGHLRNLALNNIEDIDTTGLKSDQSKDFKSAEVKIQFRAQANKPEKLDFVTLETGAAWVGSYLVKLKSGGAATVDGKAQVALGRLSFDDTTVKAVAGQPYMVSNSKYDLNSGVGGLSNYLNGDQESSLNYHPGPKDPFLLLPQYLAEATQAQQLMAHGNQDDINFDAFAYGGGNGGRGGGGMGGAGSPGYVSGQLASGYNFRKADLPPPGNHGPA